MAIVDSQGRFLGKVSILDIGAVLVILLVIVGVLLPGTTGIAQISTNTKPVEVDVIVRSVASSTLLKQGDKTKIIIRNQPFGEVKMVKVEELPRNVPVPQPDGSVKPLPDPRPEAGLTRDYIVTLAGNAQITKDGPVLGNNKIKVGTRIELEGFTYNFADLTVMDVRIKEQ
ncbi:DUF4330 domain-containing protein [Leptothermofonsia sichuanensis E412]|uniref:DUF4330 domain-containing protein n=1 Tax=Leptothermofonsia sichuanensis TaxID=2917832 RepID=UPI001CA65253|nr:DUF4330 domain-containing protein [Leptothermofonsia sichuanensis]QZZ21932.1 DUF4330 domain-containing protein [Leptothermofonsia sichuanensis E412]